MNNTEKLPEFLKCGEFLGRRLSAIPKDSATWNKQYYIFLSHL